MKRMFVFISSICMCCSCCGLGNGKVVTKEAQPDINPVIKVNLHRTDRSNDTFWMPVVTPSSSLRINLGECVVPQKIHDRVEELCEDDSFWELRKDGLYYGYDKSTDMSFIVDDVSTLVRYLDGANMVEYSCEYDDDNFEYIIVKIDDLKNHKTYVLNRDTKCFRVEGDSRDILIPKYDLKKIQNDDHDIKRRQLKDRMAIYKKLSENE